MQNHLKNQTSPYLLQHADNPVEWYPWCDEAFERAKAEDKPIFLSIGYSACFMIRYPTIMEAPRKVTVVVKEQADVSCQCMSCRKR